MRECIGFWRHFYYKFCLQFTFLIRSVNIVYQLPAWMYATLIGWGIQTAILCCKTVLWPMGKNAILFSRVPYPYFHPWSIFVAAITTKNKQKDRGKGTVVTAILCWWMTKIKHSWIKSAYNLCKTLYFSQ